MTRTHAHAHPSLVIALHTRTRAFGTANFAFAIRGALLRLGLVRPTAANVRRASPSRSVDTGKHFIELVIYRDQMCRERVLFRVGDARGTA